MAPLYDTDLAEERFEKDRWRTFELWERVEKRLKKRKRLLVFLTMILFLVISSIPVIQKRKAYWEGVRVMRKLSETVVAAKEQAALTREARYVVLENATSPGGEQGVKILLFSRKDCEAASESQKVLLEERQFFSEDLDLQLQVIDDLGPALEAPEQRFCYDPLHGMKRKNIEKEFVTFGVNPVKKLSDEAYDFSRASFLVLQGSDAVISID